MHLVFRRHDLMTCHAHIQAATCDYHRKHLWDAIKTASLTCNTATTVQTRKEQYAVILVAHLQHRYTNTECRDAAEKAVLIDTNVNLTPSCPALSLHACSSFRRIPAAKTTDPGRSSEHIMHKHDITFESVAFLWTKAAHKELYQIRNDKMIRTQ